MINDHKQEQQSGDKSTNLQANSIVVNQGITYSDAKEIALDVFKNNFLELSEKALIKAEQRATELVEDFLSKLEQQKPESLQSVESPSMQYALFSAQKEYAKTGDKDLSDILVDLLVERADKEERSLIQIVLDESIEVASKLTKPQFDVLSLVFLLKYTINHGVVSIPSLNKYFMDYFMPLCSSLTKENACYQHLEYANCASILVGPKFEEVFRDRYRGLFQKGIQKEELQHNFAELSNDKRIFTTCLRDNSLFQVNAVNDEKLDNTLSQLNIDLGLRGKIKSLFSSNLLSNDEINSNLSNIHPGVPELIDVWNTIMHTLNLTSVGIALARANIKRKTKIDLDLNIWIK